MVRNVQTVIQDMLSALMEDVVVVEVAHTLLEEQPHHVQHVEQVPLQLQLLDHVVHVQEAHILLQKLLDAALVFLVNTLIHLLEPQAVLLAQQEPFPAQQLTLLPIAKAVQPANIQLSALALVVLVLLANMHLQGLAVVSIVLLELIRVVPDLELALNVVEVIFQVLWPQDVKLVQQENIQTQDLHSVAHVQQGLGQVEQLHRVLYV